MMIRIQCTCNRHQRCHLSNICNPYFYAMRKWQSICISRFPKQLRYLVSRSKLRFLQYMTYSNTLVCKHYSVVCESTWSKNVWYQCISAVRWKKSRLAELSPLVILLVTVRLFGALFNYIHQPPGREHAPLSGRVMNVCTSVLNACIYYIFLQGDERTSVLNTVSVHLSSCGGLNVCSL